MAMLAGCYPVIVPPTPGVLSALGFLYSDVKNEFAQTFVRTIDDADRRPDRRHPDAGWDATARAWLREEGIEERRQRLNYEADVRYFRQGYEFSLEVDPDRLGSGSAQRSRRAASASAHERIYGFKLDQPVELGQSTRGRAWGGAKDQICRNLRRKAPMPPAAVVEQHRAYFDGSFTSVNVYDRTRLRAGNRVRGPAIIAQMDATTVIHPSHTGEVDEYLSILIKPDKAS